MIRCPIILRYSLTEPRGFKLTNQRVYYEVIEQVIDDRGTDSSTSTEILYTSEIKKLHSYRTNPNIKFYYPETKGLHSFEMNGASIIWQMKLKGRYLGIVMSYTGEFKVLAK